MRTAVLAAALAAGLFAILPGHASGAGDDSYRESVAQALALVRAADRQQAASTASRAAGVLRQGTGDSQPEILHDLDRRPPDLDDAQARLEALDAALGQPAPAVDGATAHSDIDRILAQHRYDQLRGGQSLIQRLQDLLLELILRLLVGLVSQAGSGWGVLVAGALGLVVLGFAAWVLWELRRRSPAEPPAPPGPGRRPLRDFFAEADRLAARGELGLAVIALAGGVAAALGGEEVWEQSPLTVRELFRRAARPDGLKPLLLAFENASYGERQPAPDQFRAAAAAAAPFRRQTP